MAIERCFDRGLVHVAHTQTVPADDGGRERATIRRTGLAIGERLPAPTDTGHDERKIIVIWDNGPYLSYVPPSALDVLSVAWGESFITT